MALTDGSYIARLKLNKLDQPYLPGETVSGSAFSGDEQVVEYIRRGWIDVDSAGSATNATNLSRLAVAHDWSTSVATTGSNVGKSVPLAFLNDSLVDVGNDIVLTASGANAALQFTQGVYSVTFAGFFDESVGVTEASFSFSTPSFAGDPTKDFAPAVYWKDETQWAQATGHFVVTEDMAGDSILLRLVTSGAAGTWSYLGLDIVKIA